MKSKSVIIMLLISILLSCNNNYKRYGEKVLLDNTEINGATISSMSYDSKLFKLRVLNNPYNIVNRSIIIKIDTVLIYRGIFSNLTDLEVNIPNKYVGKYCNPNLIVYKQSDTNGYYFESKNGLFIDTLSNTILIKFSKDKDFSDRIIFLAVVGCAMNE